MKKLIVLVLLLFLAKPVLTQTNPNQMQITKTGEIAFKFLESANSGSNPVSFLYLGNNNFFISGYYSYNNNVGPYYNNCVASANMESGTVWKHDFLVSDDYRFSNLCKNVVSGETLLVATTPSGLNYYSSSGEIKKTIPSLAGYKWFYPFFDHNLVVTMVNAIMYVHRINFETGQLLDSTYITSSVSWIDDVKQLNGNIFLNIRKPDGGVAKSLIVKLNQNGIVWQKAINKIGQSYFAITPNLIYVAGDSITMNGPTSKLIALDTNGNELWRRSFSYGGGQPMTLSRSVIINPHNNDCVIGGYSVGGDYPTCFVVSWNQFGDLMWECFDTSDMNFRLFDIFWNEINELLVCGDGPDENNSQAIVIKKYFVPGITTDVKPEDTGKPNSFSLEQNYPNPFNPSTTITFTVPVETKVTLKVYNVLGQEVAVLVDVNHHPVGTFQVPFDGHNLPSGVYFYKLTTPEYSMTKTKKMVINK